MGLKKELANLSQEEKLALLLKHRKKAKGPVKKAPFRPLYTNVYVSKPVKHETDRDDELKIIEAIKKAGIKTGVAFDIEDLPYICFTSRIKKVVAIEDFKNAIQLGNNVQLCSSLIYPFHTGPVRLTVIQKSENQVGRIIIGDNIYMPGTSIVAYNEVIIEDNVILGPNVTIMDSSGHTLTGRNTPEELERLTDAPVLIKENAWIGAGATILKGVTIGKNSVVGINSVVHKPVPDNTVVAGNPAKVIKSF